MGKVRMKIGCMLFIIFLVLLIMGCPMHSLWVFIPVLSVCKRIPLTFIARSFMRMDSFTLLCIRDLCWQRIDDGVGINRRILNFL